VRGACLRPALACPLSDAGGRVTAALGSTFRSLRNNVWTGNALSRAVHAFACAQRLYAARVAASPRTQHFRICIPVGLRLFDLNRFVGCTEHSTTRTELNADRVTLFTPARRVWFVLHAAAAACHLRLTFVRARALRANTPHGTRFSDVPTTVGWFYRLSASYHSPRS